MNKFDEFLYKTEEKSFEKCFKNFYEKKDLIQDLKEKLLLL